jgi:hypothetical protein
MTQGTTPKTATTGTRATNDNNPRVPFICACNTCVHRGEVQGDGANTQVFCLQSGSFVYASAKARDCEQHALLGASATPCAARPS